jgi:hypothetical protein
MAEFTLQQVFGAGATQTATLLTINKADLPGLTALASNTAESLLVGLIVIWLANLTETARISDEANRQIAVSDAGTDISAGLNADFLRRSYAISLYDLFVIPTLDPDNY